ncbi:MAG: NADH-quinone oxidoreductase subunit J [Deltaproteobacteria bacterium]|nr:NADH-quinone oxidoreductase subunit J [Deltaproteobacteria bacterium]
MTLFYIFAFIAIAGALGMLLNTRNTVAAALSLVVTMCALAAIYVQLDAYLIGALQVMVYAGAILVLFLFVVMLLNLRSDDFGGARYAKPLLATLGAAAIGAGFLTLLPGAFGPAAELSAGFGGYREVGRELFTNYVLAFEVTSLLLLGAMIGAVILAKRKID